MLLIHQRNADGSYGPTNKGKLYVSKFDHRRTAAFNKNKTRWCIEEGEEYHVFKIADEPVQSWFCNENKCLFSLVDDCKVILGESGERIAKFPLATDNVWHGYPVFCIKDENSPSDELLDVLVKSGVISDTTKRRIERRKI